MKKNRKRIYILLLIIFLTVSCVNVSAIDFATPVPTFDSSTLVTEISQQDSFEWTLMQMESPVLDPPPQNSPQLVIGLDGRLHLFWDTLASGDSFIYHAYFQDGTWSTPSAISLSLGTSKLFTTPVVSPDGVIHVIWKNDLKLGGPYRLLYTSFDGINWGEEIEVYTSESDIGLWGELFVDERSVLHAIVRASDGIKPSYFYLTQNNDHWSSSEPITPKTGLDGLVTWQYKPLPSGRVLLYGKDLNRNLRLSYWEAGETNSVVKTNIQLPIYTDFFVDSSANYYIYWTGQVPIPGGATTGAYYQCIDTQARLWSEAVLSGEKTVITKPLIAQNKSLMVMAWINRDNTIEFLLPNGCESAKVYSLTLPESKTQKQLLAMAVNETPKGLCFLYKHNYNEFALYCSAIP